MPQTPRKNKGLIDKGLSVVYNETMKKLKYTPLKLEQRSEEWLEWRKSGIGASEASVIMGSLPFDFEDVLDLWKKKAGLPVAEFVMTDAIQRGIDLEDEALEKFTEATGITMEPTCFTHPEHSFLRASLDGIDKKMKQAVEIKCPASTKYYKAKKGIVLDYYYTQLQQQMACCGVQEMFYWVYRQKEGGVLIKVPRNDEYIEELIRRASIFWQMVLDKIPCIPRHLGIDPYGDSDPFIAGEHKTELVGVYKN
jgi:putative phage-type endonuclease